MSGISYADRRPALTAREDIMATVRVLTATSFSSDDFWGPTDAKANSIVQNNAADTVSLGFLLAYGSAALTSLTWQLTGDLNSASYSGSYTSIKAFAGAATEVANATFSPGVPVAFNTFTLDSLFDADFQRFLNPELPALRFAGADDMQGNSGNDVLRGYAGNDLLDGRAGHDTLIGGAGDDGIIGGPDIDTMIGGPGNDTFIINAGDLAAGEFIVGSEPQAAAGEVNALLVSGTNSFIGVGVLGIQALAFGAGGANVTVASLQFSSTGISNALFVLGGAGTDTITITDNAGVFDLSAWTFAGFTDGIDTITVNG